MATDVSGLISRLYSGHSLAVALGSRGSPSVRSRGSAAVGATLLQAPCATPDRPACHPRPLARNTILASAVAAMMARRCSCWFAGVQERFLHVVEYFARPSRSSPFPRMLRRRRRQRIIQFFVVSSSASSSSSLVFVVLPVLSSSSALRPRHGSHFALWSSSFFVPYFVLFARFAVVVLCPKPICLSPRLNVFFPRGTFAKSVPFVGVVAATSVPFRSPGGRGTGASATCGATRATSVPTPPSRG